MDVAEAVNFRRVTKFYGANRAVADASFSIGAGEVRALLGKNGAGKSTLIKVLSGAVRPDGGEVFVSGERLTHFTPKHSIERGVATVYQELTLVPELSVADNILLGDWRRATSPLGLSRSRAGRTVKPFLAMLDADIDPHVPVGRLPLAEQQTVEIARGLSRGARVLVLDEPTSALSEQEAQRLIRRIRGVAATGVTVIYVSHRMSEIPLVADRFTVVRDGRIITTRDVATTSSAEIAGLITGDEQSPRLTGTHVPRERSEPADEVLHLSAFGAGDRVRDVQLSVCAGEIVGVAGLEGSGRSELVQALFGQHRGVTGEVNLDGQPYHPRTARHGLDRGIGFVPHDRKRLGLVLGMSIEHNVTLPILDRLSLAGVIKHRPSKKATSTALSEYAIYPAEPDRIVGELSGGNQQKALLAKSAARDPRLLLLDEPTRGVDIAAKRQIYRAIRHRADQGTAVLVASSEIDELIELCDRVIVMRSGRIAMHTPAKGAVATELLAAAMKGENE